MIRQKSGRNYMKSISKLAEARDTEVDLLHERLVEVERLVLEHLAHISRQILIFVREIRWNLQKETI